MILTSVFEDTEKSTPSCIDGGTIKWYSCFGKLTDISSKFNHEQPYDPATTFLQTYPGELKAYTNTETYTQVFIAV